MLSEAQYQGPAMIVGWAGRVDGDNGDDFEEELLAATKNRGRYVVVDGSEIEYVSSAGIRAFLMVAQELEETEQKMVLCGLRPEVKRVFTTIGFAEIMPIYEDTEEAVKAA